MKPERPASLPPGPGGLGLRRLVRRMSDGAGFYEELRERYGDAVYFRMLHRRICVLSGPDEIGEVLVAKRASFHKGPIFKRMLIFDNPTSVTADGEDHARLRRLVRSSFGRASLEGYAREMIVEAARMREGWRDGDVVDLVPALRSLAFNVVTATLFGRGLRIEQSVVSDTLQALRWSMKLTMVPLGGLAARLPLPANAFRRKACRRMSVAMKNRAYMVISATSGIVTL